MRMSRIALPFSLALGLTGLVMYLSAKPGPTTQTELDFSQPEHKVTPEMTAAAAARALKPAPSFSRLDVKGESRTISGKLQRPQLLLFILDTCPCSVDAQPIFNRFAKHWAGKVDFLGVINTDAKKGRSWMSDYRVAFPVVPDAGLEIIEAYKAQQSVYSALISTEGQIVKLWPGYSQGLFKEMNETLAKESRSKVVPFDAQYAPVEDTTGCYFAK